MVASDCGILCKVVQKLVSVLVLELTLMLTDHDHVSWNVVQYRLRLALLFFALVLGQEEFHLLFVHEVGVYFIESHREQENEKDCH
jgi:hypothetical protein